MKVFYTFLLILIALISNCESKKNHFSEKEISLLAEVFQETQKMHEGLLLSPPTLLIDGISKSINNLGSSDHPRIKDWKSRLTENIPKNPKDLENSFANLSNLSLILVEIKKEVTLPEKFQQFYCPMVEKYWVSNDKEIRNPYAPEMRECGEILPDSP